MTFIRESKPVDRGCAADVVRYLERDPLFHGRTASLQIEQSNDCIILTGTLPSFYLKQMLQEALRPLHLKLENHVHVISANGVSAIDRE